MSKSFSKCLNSKFAQFVAIVIYNGCCDWIDLDSPFKDGLFDKQISLFKVWIKSKFWAILGLLFFAKSNCDLIKRSKNYEFTASSMMQTFASLESWEVGSFCKLHPMPIKA